MIQRVTDIVQRVVLHTKLLLLVVPLRLRVGCLWIFSQSSAVILSKLYLSVVTCAV